MGIAIPMVVRGCSEILPGWSGEKPRCAGCVECGNAAENVNDQFNALEHEHEGSASGNLNDGGDTAQSVEPEDFSSRFWVTLVNLRSPPAVEGDQHARKDDLGA